MAAVPPDDPGALPTQAQVRELVSMKATLDRLLRRRLTRDIAVGLLAVALLAVALTYGLAIAGNHSLAQQNQVLITRVAHDERHLAAAVACQDAYDRAVALNHRRQDEVTKRFRRATRLLITQAGHARSHAEFQADIATFNRAYRASNRIPTVAPPPPACR